MGGSFSIGGLITGLNSNELIAQLMQLERQPILRIQDRIARLEQERTAVRDLRTQLQTVRNGAQDFRLNDMFNQFRAVSSGEGVLNASISGQNPVVGSYTVEVLALASATRASSSARLGAAIDPNASLESSGIAGGITEGQFTVNGVQFTVDPATQSLNDILGQINASAAGVTATYDAASDTVTFENSTPGDTSLINFGGTGDVSNFVTAIAVGGATQSTGVNGSTVVTSTRNLGAVNPGAVLDTVNFEAGAVTSGSFSINGITFNVDTATDSISDVLARINSSDAQVSASYDSATDTIRVVSTAQGSRTIRFTAGTSNFLDVTNLTTAVQEAGTDSQFTVNGGPVQTRNSNQVTDAIGGVTLDFTSLGASTVTVSTDEESIVEGVRTFLDEINTALRDIADLIGENGRLSNDNTIRIIQSFLRTTLFDRVEGLGGNFQSLAEIGISTGSGFEAGSVAQVSLDEEVFLQALRDDRQNVQGLFANADETGVADRFFEFLDGVTGTNGFLNERVRANGSIDSQINTLNDRIGRIEERLVMRERRLRLQFSRLEQLASSFQQQGGALAGLQGANGFQGFL
jgi:flagellar hook-associated protein 2